jgi:type I restriction enzyme S subunit
MSIEKFTLGELCTIEKGTTGILKAIPGEYPLVVTGEERKSHNEFQFDDNAVIIPLVSGTGHGHASIKRIHFQTGKFALGSILCAIIPKDKSKLNAEYLYYFLDLNRENELVARMRGMANVTLPMKEIAKIEIPLPNLREQIAFVKMYKLLGKKSNDLSLEFKYQLNLVKKLRQQLLQDAVQGKLVEQDLNDEPASVLLKKIKDEKAQLIKDKKLKKEKELPKIKLEEIPFDIPENWVWCRLGEISEIGTGATPLTSNPEYYINGDIAFVTSSATGKSFINSAEFFITKKAVDETNCKVYSKGTLIVAMYGQGKTRGQVTELNIEAATNQACATISLFINELYLRKYVKIFFQKIYDEIRELAQGGAQPNLNMGKVRDTLISLPPIEEQHRIVNKLNKLMQRCDALEVSIKQSQQQNEQLLQQVLREALSKEVEPEAAI